MRRIKRQDMSDGQLVERYTEISLAQDSALRYDEIAKFNKLYLQKKEVEDELRSRPGDRRRLLQHLYEHKNAQVRRNAAVATLALAPDAARRVLERILSDKEFPQAGDVGMLLSGLDDGTWRPI